jgi:predicted ester cyclase
VKLNSKKKQEEHSKIKMVRAEQLKYLAKQVLERGNYNIVENAFSADYIAHPGDNTYQGHKFIKSFVKQLRTSIPDIKIDKTEILSQIENLVTWQRFLKRTHKVKLKGIPASDKKVK